MDSQSTEYVEKPLVKTKIIATVGPASRSPEMLRKLVLAGVDIFRLNFAHGSHRELAEVVTAVRAISVDLARPIGILGDLSGPKIRLGTLPEDGIHCYMGDEFEFVREADPGDPHKLTSTYEQLIDDLQIGDRVLLADGTVSMVVTGKHSETHRVVCKVEQPGLIRSRQGINLPGVTLSTPSLTPKDRADLTWAIEHELDFVGLSFVRSAKDIKELREVIAQHESKNPPHIVAKIEKIEAISELDAILELTDAVMVARGDLGVEVDIARVPALQKQIILMCNQHRIPVITATQMLDSMQENERPTRAEASDVANAVLDGSDAVMLSGETAIGRHPATAVKMMSRIAYESERMVRSNPSGDSESALSSRATLMTEAVTLGAGAAAEHLSAELIALATHSGKTALALSKQRSKVPIIALTDNPEAARRMCLYWGISPHVTKTVSSTPQELTEYVAEWGRGQGVLGRGSRFVLVTSSDWSKSGKDLMMVHAVH